jgi:hypothetical protein
VQFGGTRLGICVGDVSGKGLTAALLKSNLQAAFRAFATAEASSVEVCAKLNGIVAGNVAPGKFITSFYVVVDVEKRTLVYENAGHSPAFLLRAEGKPEFLRGHGAVLGVIRVRGGAASRGVRGGERVSGAMNRRLMEEVAGFCRGHFRDDVTVVALTIR